MTLIDDIKVTIEKARERLVGRGDFATFPPGPLGSALQVLHTLSEQAAELVAREESEPALAPGLLEFTVAVRLPSETTVETIHSLRETMLGLGHPVLSDDLRLLRVFIRVDPMAPEPASETARAIADAATVAGFPGPDDYVEAVVRAMEVIDEIETEARSYGLSLIIGAPTGHEVA